jgi:Terminase large subunit, T4likevirus-type, N-terminal
MYIKNPAASVPPLIFKLEDFLFDKQLKFVQDPHAFKIAVCSRRSGKTIACAADLIHTALSTKDVVCLYITLSRNNAKKLIWPEIQKINRKYCLGGSPDATELSMSFPNGSVVYLSGAKDRSEIEKFRGLALKKVYIDECQSFREYIQDLIDDILAPALLDYAGTLCLIGTPGPVPAGFFAEVAGVVQDRLEASEAWSHHGWTFFDNPHIEIKSGYTHQQLLMRELKRRGVTEDNPSIQREFFGRWVLDSDSLWIHYNKELNNYTTLDTTKHRYNYILGIDLGYVDADALALLAWSETDPNTYLVEELVADKQGLTELVAHIKDFQSRYDISKMVIDEGGLGKKLAEEMRRQHGIPLQAADKARKQENVAFLNDALRTGRFKAKYESHFVKDSFLVEIDRTKSRPDKIKLSDKYHSDIIDSVLYAFKESPAFAYEPPPPPKPKWGTIRTGTF